MRPKTDLTERTFDLHLISEYETEIRLDAQDDKAEAHRKLKWVLSHSARAGMLDFALDVLRPYVDMFKAYRDPEPDEKTALAARHAQERDEAEAEERERYWIEAREDTRRRARRDRGHC